MAARSQILLAARAAKIHAFDSVFSDVKDKEGFLSEVTYIKGLGFDGKSLVNPNQISVYMMLMLLQLKMLIGH